MSARRAPSSENIFKTSTSGLKAANSKKDAAESLAKPNVEIMTSDNSEPIKKVAVEDEQVKKETTDISLHAKEIKAEPIPPVPSFEIQGKSVLLNLALYDDLRRFVAAMSKSQETSMLGYFRSLVEKHKSDPEMNLFDAINECERMKNSLPSAKNKKACYEVSEDLRQEFYRQAAAHGMSKTDYLNYIYFLEYDKLRGGK